MPFVDLGYASIHYRERGVGPALVLIMGTGADHTSWARQVPALSAGFRLITPDNRGSGRSTPDPSVDATCADFARETIALLDAIGVFRFHVAGYSLGAAIAMEVALAAPSRVIAASFHAGWARGNPATTQALEGSLAAAARGAEAFLEAACRRNLSPAFRESEGFAAFLANVSRSKTRATLQGILAQTRAGLRHDVTDRIATLAHPVLVTTGEHDPVAPPAVAADLAARIPGARLHVFRGPRAWHATPIEMAEEFNALMLAFHGESGRPNC